MGSTAKLCEGIFDFFKELWNILEKITLSKNNSGDLEATNRKTKYGAHRQIEKVCHGIEMLFLQISFHLRPSHRVALHHSGKQITGEENSYRNCQQDEPKRKASHWRLFQRASAEKWAEGGMLNGRLSRHAYERKVTLNR